jgi:hypothetical protein
VTDACLDVVGMALPYLDQVLMDSYPDGELALAVVAGGVAEGVEGVEHVEHVEDAAGVEDVERVENRNRDAHDREMEAVGDLAPYVQMDADKVGRLKGVEGQIPANLEAFGQVQDDEAQVDHDIAVADTGAISHPVEGTASINVHGPRMMVEHCLRALSPQKVDGGAVGAVGAVDVVGAVDLWAECPDKVDDQERHCASASVAVVAQQAVCPRKALDPLAGVHVHEDDSSPVLNGAAPPSRWLGGPSCLVCAEDVHPDVALRSASARMAQGQNHAGSGAAHACARERTDGCVAVALEQALNVHLQGPYPPFDLQVQLEHQQDKVEPQEEEPARNFDRGLALRGTLVRFACVLHVPLPPIPRAETSHTGSLREDQGEMFLQHDEEKLRDLAIAEQNDGLEDTQLIGGSDTDLLDRVRTALLAQWMKLRRDVGGMDVDGVVVVVAVVVAVVVGVEADGDVDVDVDVRADAGVDASAGVAVVVVAAADMMDAAAAAAAAVDACVDVGDGDVAAVAAAAVVVVVVVAAVAIAVVGGVGEDVAGMKKRTYAQEVG